MTLLGLNAAAGTQADVVARLKAVLPAGWFPDSTPVLDGVLNGIAAAWTGLFGLLGYVQLQTRIATASELFLDLVSQDYLGTLPRFPAEPDASFRARISATLLRGRNTRAALAAAVGQITSRAPVIFEPQRIGDTGAYTIAATLAYNTAGGWGSFGVPFQIFVHAYRPIGAGVSAVLGYGTGAGGYGVGAAEYTTPAMAANQVRDADIAAAIADTLPAAVTAWLAVGN